MVGGPVSWVGWGGYRGIKEGSQGCGRGERGRVRDVAP